MKVYLVRSRHDIVYITSMPYRWNNIRNQWCFDNDCKEDIHFTREDSDREFYQYLLTLVPKTEEPVEIEL